MLIYDWHHWFKQSYSSINRNAMKYLMEETRKCTINYGLWGGSTYLGYNSRFLSVEIDYSADQHDFFIINNIHSRHYLPLRSNHDPFYEMNSRSTRAHHLQFRKGLYSIPLTFTSAFLYDPANDGLYKNITVVLYEKKMKVKLGFCGSHLDKHKITPLMDRW